MSAMRNHEGKIDKPSIPDKILQENLEHYEKISNMDKNLFASKKRRYDLVFTRDYLKNTKIGHSVVIKHIHSKMTTPMNANKYTQSKLPNFNTPDISKSKEWLTNFKIAKKKYLNKSNESQIKESENITVAVDNNISPRIFNNKNEGTIKKGDKNFVTSKPIGTPFSLLSKIINIIFHN